MVLIVVPWWAATACGSATSMSTSGSSRASGSSTAGVGGRGGGGQGGTAASSGNGAAVGGASTTGGGGHNGVLCDWGESLDVDLASVVRPVDAVWVVSNGASMAAVRHELELAAAGFVDQLAVAGAAPQLVVLSTHGPSTDALCVPPPLNPVADCNGTPGDAPTFHHYAHAVGATEPLCAVLDTLDGDIVDTDGLHPQGWQKWLRGDALRAVLFVTDDAVDCTTGGDAFSDSGPDPTLSSGAAAQMAVAWDQALRASSSFEVSSWGARNYRVDSLVGLAAKQIGSHGYGPLEPTQTTTCSDEITAAAPGLGYQWASRGTEGSRFPSCAPAAIPAVVSHLASTIATDAIDPCRYAWAEGPIEKAPALGITYSPSNGQTLQESFLQVLERDACGQSAQAFYIADGLINLCPNTCAKLNADPDGHIEGVCLIP